MRGVIRNNNQNIAKGIHLLFNPASHQGADFCINILLSWIDDINIKNDEGNTPLHLSVFSGNFFNFILEKSKLIRKLVSKGADLNIKNNNGLTPLELAKARKIYNIVDLLESNDFSGMESQFLRLNCLSKNYKKFKYYNMVAFIILHIICIAIGYFTLCQSK